MAPSSTMTDKEELAALVAWLQTFDVFGVMIPTGLGQEKVLESLSQLSTSRAIWKVAEEICGDQQDKPRHSSDEIWTSLLILTSTRARPVADGSQSAMTPARLKLYVLSNLLDCAVQCPDLEQRRSYIQAIMTLDKAIQKILMALIERRAGTKKSPKKSALKSHSTTPPRSSSRSPPRGTPSRVPASTAKIYPATPTLPPPSTDAKSTLLPPSVLKNKDGLSSSRRSLLSTPPKSALRSSSRELTPGTMESPQKLQALFLDFKSRNEQLEEILTAYKEREDELQAKIQKLEAKHRAEMIKFESSALDQHNELQEQFQARLEKLARDKASAEEEAAKGRRALEELARAREELDVLQHKGHVLAETTEKLRKYKEKVTELQDIKDALQREQDARAQQVDEIVRLENELQALAPVKRQLEDYKIRAIEAEVKLVETQDYLKRLEQKANDQSMANEYLYQGALMQKEQMEELQRRIEQETRAALEKSKGVGDGVNELNPELMEEVLRLRNENVQLRNFASKRQADAVEKMEAQLDDAQRLSDRYKQEYLETRSKLSETQDMLEDAKERLAEAEEEVRALSVRVEVSERHGRTVEEKFAQCMDDLEETKMRLESSQKHATKLEQEVEAWMERASDAEHTSSERLDKWQHAQDELDETNRELSQMGAKVAELVEEQQQLGKEYHQVQEDLTFERMRYKEAQQRLSDCDAKIQKLVTEKAQLQESLEEEKQARHEAMEEAHRSLQSTREILMQKAAKELEEVQGNMNCLLDDERRANRRKDEEHKREISDINAKWKSDYDEMQNRMTLTVKHSREEEQERIALLKREFEEEIKQMQQQLKEAEEERAKLIHKGKGMINETIAKSRAELQAMENTRRDLEQRLLSSEKEKEEVEKLLRSKVAGLKQKLDFANGQIGDFSRETEDLQEQIKNLEHEKYKLQEDNGRYRRQLGGMYGADGKVQAQIDRLQNECNALLQENRNLKQQARHGGMMTSISEDTGDSYSRGGASSRSTISQLRREYEETIETLNDEKRELVMKNSAAITDVQKAEQLAWEREQEVSRLQAELTSLKLALARAELDQERSVDHGHDGLTENRSPKDLSFLTAIEDMRSPNTQDRRGRSNSHDSISSRSPSLSRAMQQRAEQEANLRSRISSLTGNTPPRAPRTSLPEDNILSPTRRHDQAANRDSHRDNYSSAGSTYKERESHHAKLSSDVYGIGSSNNSIHSMDSRQSSHEIASLDTYPTSLSDSNYPWEADRRPLAEDGRPECQQS